MEIVNWLLLHNGDIYMIKRIIYFRVERPAAKLTRTMSQRDGEEITTHYLKMTELDPTKKTSMDMSRPYLLALCVFTVRFPVLPYTIVLSLLFLLKPEALIRYVLHGFSIVIFILVVVPFTNRLIIPSPLISLLPCLSLVHVTWKPSSGPFQEPAGGCCR